MADLIKSYFEGAEVEVVKRVVREGEEYFRVRARIDGVVLEVREYWSRGELRFYGYQLIVGHRAVLRYNNAPHWPSVRTFPHHKHVGGRVEELREVGLSAFLDEARSLLRARAPEPRT